MRIFPPATIGTMLALPTCSPRSGQNTVVESSVPATNDGKGIKLLDVSYDITHDFYKEYNLLSAKGYQAKHNGEAIDIQQSHGGSSKQTLSVASGLAADIITVNQTSDIGLLGQKGLIKPDWTKRLPDSTVPYTSITVFLVRKGNPKQIRDWPDLTRNNVQVVIASPEATGNGRYVFLGTYGYGLKANNDGENKAKKSAAALLKDTPVFENGGHTATTTFSQRNIGDAPITLENEANHVSKKLAPNQFKVVYSSYTILPENPVAAVDSTIEKKGVYIAAEEYLQYLWSKLVQELTAKFYLRPRDAEVSVVRKADFPETETFSLNEKSGPWEGIMKKYFSDGGLVNQLSPKK